MTAIANCQRVPQITNAAVTSGHNMIVIKRDSGFPVTRLIRTNIAITNRMNSRTQDFQRRLNGRVHVIAKNRQVAARVSQCKPAPGAFPPRNCRSYARYASSMKIASAPPSFRTRSDSSSSSVQMNSEVARPNSGYVSADRPSLLTWSANQAPPAFFLRLLTPLMIANSLSSAPDFIKRLFHRAQRKIDLVRHDRQHRRKPDNVVSVERPVQNHPVRDRKSTRLNSSHLGIS